MGSFTTRYLYRLIKKKRTDTPGAGHGVMQFYNLVREPAEAFVSWIFFYIAFHLLDWPSGWVEACSSHIDLPAASEFVYRASFVWVCTFLALRILAYTVQSLSNDPNQRVAPQAVMFLREAGRITIYLVALLVFMGYTLGRDVGALVGGLGISGLALAFAAKETIENLIASVIIFLDKPFSVGDFVDVGGVKGTVELVGLRSTRIRTIDRSLVTIPNRKVVDSNLENTSVRPSARHRIRLGVKHGTTPAQILHIRESLLAFLDQHPNVVEPSSVFFNDLQDNGGYFLVQYYIGPIDMSVIWGTQQDVNLYILELFSAQGIEFAEFPR